jgi:hypothetical protein
MPDLETDDPEPSHFHFFDCTQFDDSYRTLAVKNLELKEIEHAFMLNMDRLRSLAWLPIKLVAVSVLQEGNRIQAINNLGLRAHAPELLFGGPNFNQKQWDKVDAERQRLIHEFQHSFQDAQSFNNALTGVGYAGLYGIIQAGQAMGGQEEVRGVQGIFYALLMGAWTAFEALAQDLWVKVVNLYPVPLAQRVFEPGSKLELEKPEKKESKSISWKTLSSYGFNLTGNMGTMLQSQKSVDFQALKSIKAAYGTIFEGDTDAIFSDPKHSKLDILEATRNLLAHKGGLIDRKFIDRVSKVAGFSGATEGDEIFFTGPITKIHIGNR